MLQERFGWHATQALENVNAGNRAGYSEITPALFKAIKRYNHWDFLLYEEILRIFPRN
jgi:hypothetical protein